MPANSRHNVNASFGGRSTWIQQSPTQPPPHAAPPFRPSASLLTMLTVVASFIILCTASSYGSTSFALAAARPTYALYPPLAAAMLVGGMCAWLCYLPTTLAVLCFLLLFRTGIRARGTPPAGVHNAAPPVHWRPLLWSLVRDGADTIKFALVLVPVYVLAVGGAGRPHVEARALDAASGGQLAAAIMTLKIMLVTVREIWGLVPLVVLRWDKGAYRGGR